ncbi:hypothetical protein, partial [Roseisolibacter sp. H3M3-2]|uniref:hypothetical protein n=1 Tax=Roseisolibacter sp. H3M3-2 TaxID=3031323 RepID=UPI0023D9D68C
MSAADKVQGLAEAHGFLAKMPTAAHEQMVVELGIIARDVNALQRNAVPVDTGRLKGALGFRMLAEQLRVRIGLFRAGFRSGQSNTFYGRIIEFGRRAQTVLVQRRRRVNGSLRSSRGR